MIANALFKNRSLLRLVIAGSLAASLLGCATHDRSRAMDAVTAPLADINLIQVEIPPLLQTAEMEKYQLPDDTGCSALAQQVTDFDAILGNDIDVEESEQQSLYNRGRQEVKDATFNALKSTSESVIPFRGWVRKLSGAKRHSDKVQSAIHAGSLRRAYLKGLLNGQGCSS